MAVGGTASSFYSLEKRMIVEYIRYTIADDQRRAFEDGYTQAQTALITSPHWRGHELAQCVEDPGSYILRIEWDSVEGHLQGFRTSPAFRTFFAAIQPFVTNITEMRHYAVTAIAGTSTREPTAQPPR
jgi:heme-degrading monooxygenase HmoA